jgi:hypothetical protein
LKGPLARSGNASSFGTAAQLRTDRFCERFVRRVRRNKSRRAPITNKRRRPYTTLVLDRVHSAFSTGAINHDLIALPIYPARASRDNDGINKINKKRQTIKSKTNSGNSEETTEQ